MKPFDKQEKLKKDKIEDEKTYNDIPDYLGRCPDCPRCGETMKYSYIASEFKCFDCGFLIDEQDMDFDIDYDDPNNPPYGCSVCGGPWPHCKTSCKLFDD